MKNEALETSKIGQNINAIRKARKMTKKELTNRMAEILGHGVSEMTVCNHTKTGRMTTQMLMAYAKALGCTIADICEGVTDMQDFELKEDLGGRYPYNLAVEVAGGDDSDIYSIYIPALLESMKSLTDREQKILEMRFRHYMTLEQCGKVYGVTHDRIRQIEAKAIRKLRHPSHYKHWKMDVMNTAWEIAKERDALKLEVLRLSKLVPDVPTIPVDDVLYTSVPIDNMELSVRAYNCLKRAGFDTVEDLRGVTVDRLMRVRNLGRKSMEEVIAKLKDWGIEVSDMPA